MSDTSFATVRAPSASNLDIHRTTPPPRGSKDYLRLPSSAKSGPPSSESITGPLPLPTAPSLQKTRQESPLIIEPPSDIVFHGPFNIISTSLIKLHNRSDRRLAFKIKTTAFKRYCVRPNSGFIAPHETAPVAIMLQPGDMEPGERMRHKFMVQALFVPESFPDPDDIDLLWRGANPGDFIESKLKCMFKQGEEGSHVGGSLSFPSVGGPRRGVQQLATENAYLHSRMQEMMSEISTLKDDRQKAASGGLVIVFFFFFLGCFIGVGFAYLFIVK